MSEQLADYEVRSGRDGKMGIYLRAYNVRLATFAANSSALQTALMVVLDVAAADAKAKKTKQK
jgi:hypothetical protein